MHICYLYIYDFGVLKNIGLSFDHRYVFQMGDDTLKIDRNKTTLPDNFWGQGVYSFTAIVGNNGSGKTTALQLMKKLFIEGEPRNAGVDVLIIYEQGGRLYSYNPKRVSIKCGAGIRITNLSERERIETLYYSGHFQPYTGADGEMELSGSYDASDAWLLIKDLLDYSNVDTYHLNEPIYSHLSAYYAQNNYRICEVLMLEGLDKLLPTFRLPQYVMIAPNRGGWNAINLDYQGRFKDLQLPNEKYVSIVIRERAIERIIYYDIINLIAEGKGDSKKLLSFLYAWLDSGDQPVINTLWDENQDKIEAFYPLSPISALMVCFNPGERYSEENVDETFVNAKNTSIAKEAYLHIFANGEQVLKYLLN